MFFRLTKAVLITATNTIRIVTTQQHRATAAAATTGATATGQQHLQVFRMMATSPPQLQPSSKYTLPPVTTTDSSSATSPSSSSSSTTRTDLKMREEVAIESLWSTPTQCNISNPPKHKQHKQYEQQQRQQQHSTLMQPLLVINKNILLTAVALVFCIFLRTTSASPVFVDNPSLAQFQSGRNIRHLPCIVRKSGRSGVCMFAIDCMKQNGTHLGTCIDRFYFGSCCQMQEDTPLYAPEINDNSIDQNTISHFVHESTTLPTSALFRVTTESPNQESPSAGITKNVTNAISMHTTTVSASVSRSPPTPTTSSSSTSASSSSLRPAAVTTPHKQSHFVVRTTFRPKPQIIGKPTIEPTTIKPPKRKTTTWPHLLTTTAPTTLSPQLEDRVELTTLLPQKFFTFQVVETTTGSATESPNNSDDVPTLITTQRPPRPTSASLVTTSTARPTISKRKPPLPSTFRPPPTRKPIQTRRPAGKPTLKPDSTKPGLVNKTTTAPGRRPSPALDETLTATNTIEVRTTLTPASTTSTTKASRPKPKPTAAIVKVPRPTVGVTDTTARPAPTTTTTTTTTTIKTSTASSSTVIEEGYKKPETTPETQVQSNSTSRPTSSPTALLTSTSTATLTQTTAENSTPKKPPMITTTTMTAATTTTTEKPLIVVSSTTTASTTTRTTMRTTPTLATTEAPKINDLILPTTQKPGLVTWTNVDGEPLPNATSEEDWRPPPEEWVPLVAIAPETHVNKTTTASITEAPESSSTQKIIVSITSSVSEITNNASTSIKPEQLTNITDISRPTSNTTSTTSTTGTTTNTTTTTAHQPTSTTTTLTTESPAGVLVSSTVDSTLSAASTASTTETPSSSTTTEYINTEDYSGALNSTTVAPVNTLEGVDYRQVCGRRMFPEPRIVGGSNAAFGRWPWQISLRQWRTSTYLHKCGAALLNENWAITAAHCVDNVPPSDLLLRLGEYDLAEEEEPYGYQERRVQIVASHPQFDPRTFEYDLALLRFYEPVIFQPNIIPVCVPDNDFDFIGQTAFVTGWGRLYEDGPLPSVLQEVAVPVINNSICETMYRAAGYIEHIPHIFICAGWKKGGYDSCEGDSGGPMVLQREEDKRFQLGGVISWGIGCAEANQPGVYTRISEFRDWINQILQF